MDKIAKSTLFLIGCLIFISASGCASTSKSCHIKCSGGSCGVTGSPGFDAWCFCKTDGDPVCTLVPRG